MHWVPTSARAKVWNCIFGAKNAVAKAINQLKGRRFVASAQPFQFKLEGEPMDEGDVPANTWFVD